MALIDDVRITIKAGKSGEDAVTRDGGTGGRGGSIYFQASNNISDLNKFRFTKKIEGNNGDNGLDQNKSGKNGEDIVILVPPGTKITDEGTGEVIEILDTTTPVLLAKGGRRYQGPHESYSSHPKALLRHPDERPGEIKHLHLIQSLIADVGLVGKPNAGKSSLLRVLTNATPEVGDYEFTTLEPNLGTYEKLVLADIPGLIEGAAHGSGLGVDFLKHIEKTKMLMHCVSTVDQDPVKTYKTIREEFKLYNPELLEKDEIILLTKTDLVDKATLADLIKKMKRLKRKVLSVSIYDSESIASLKKTLLKLKSK